MRQGKVVKRQATMTIQAETVSCEEVAQVAYELFRRRGGVHGHHQEDWFEAERIVRQRRRGRGR